MSVNRPTDVKQKEKDINNKLQLYGIFQAFSNGKVPSNKQIDITLNSLLESRALKNPSNKLSSEGQQLVAELRQVIEQAKLLLLTKNEGNLLQDFIWHTEQLSGGNASTPDLPVDKQTAQQHANDALQGLRTLGTLMISNGQFRKLLSDASILLRDMAGDAATKAATKVRPSEDRLNQIDQPAEDNTWHDVPDMSRDNIKNQIKGQYNQQKPLSRDDIRDATGDATQTAHPGDSRNPQDVARLSARDQQEGGDSGVDARSGAQSGLQTLRDRASQNLPDETKDRAKDVHGRAKNYLSDKIPQERREQTIWRLKKMVVEIQGHQDYQQAIETLLRLAEIYAGHTKNLAQQGQSNVKGAHEDDHLNAAEKDLRILIERFANSTSLDDLFDSINDIYRDADRDPELKNWFKKLDAYIRRCLQEQGFIMQDAATDQWNDIYDHGQFLLRDRYRDHTNRVIDETKFLADQFAEDPQSKRFGESMQKLFNDLGNDKNGKPTFKPHLVKDLVNVILPAAFENIRYVPIPRIEYTDHMMDAVVENLVIESDNLMPNVLEIENDNYYRLGRKQVSSKNAHSVMVSASGIQCDLRDVSYYIKKKEGFPSLTDTGLADIFMGGQGFSFKMRLSTADKKDRQHFFKVEKLDVDVKHLNITLKQSKHKMLFNLFKPLLFKVVRPAIQKVLEKQIKDSIHQLDGICWEIYQEAEKAANEVADDPDKAPNVYNRYYNAVQKKMLQGKKKTEAVAADKKVNVTLTQHDSIFPNIKLPGGISTKATEYKELAARGDKWESPIFTIGSAKESSNIPSPPPITRKHHQTAQGGLRGGNQPSQSNTGNFSNQVNQAFEGRRDQDYEFTHGNAPALNGNANYSNEKRDVSQGYQNTVGRITS